MSEPYSESTADALVFHHCTVEIHGKPLVDHLDLVLPKGEWLGIIGPSGAGKSSLIKGILGLHPIRHGSVSINGITLTPHLIARKIAWVPQRLQNLQGFRVFEWVLQSRYPHAVHALWEGKEDLHIVREVLEALELWTLRDRWLSTLSGGELQRVLLASALVQKADWIFLDEPTSALDLPNAMQWMQWLKSLSQAQGFGVLWVSHELNLLSQYCHRFLAIDGQGHWEVGAFQPLVQHLWPHRWIWIDHPQIPKTQILPKYIENQNFSVSFGYSEVLEELKTKYRGLSAWSAMLWIATALFAALIGHHWIYPSQLLTPSPDGFVFWKIRLPRVVLGLLTGSTLAFTGTAFQGFLQNPLATPYTLGIAGGATLGAVLGLIIGMGPLALWAFGGALCSSALVYGLSQRGTHGHALLLAGIALSIASSALVSLLQFWGGQQVMVQSLRWMMGGLEIIGWHEILIRLPWIGAGAFLIMRHAKALNLMAVDRDWAESKGICTSCLEKQLFWGASLMVGAIISLTGPIGFVGLIVPHFLRLRLGNDHRLLLPLSFWIGGLFLAWIDALTRTLAGAQEWPVGIMTALIGGPFLIFLLYRRGS